MSNQQELLPMDVVEKLDDVVLIPRTWIKPFPRQPRTYFNKAELLELADSIKENGQRVPIFVMPYENNNGSAYRYVLIDGQRRWHACDIASVKKMKAIVMPAMGEEEQFAFSVACNFGRVGHTLLETAQAIKRLQDYGKNISQIRKIFARSRTWVEQHLKLLKLDGEVIALMSPEIPEKKRLTILTALDLADLPEDSQKRIARIVVEKRLKHSQAKGLIRKEMRKLGVGGELLERSSRQEYHILRNFVSRVKRESELLLQISQAGFKRMFEFRGESDRIKMVEGVAQDIENLQLLLSAIQQIKSK